MGFGGFFLMEFVTINILDDLKFNSQKTKLAKGDIISFTEVEHSNLEISFYRRRKGINIALKVSLHKTFKFEGFKLQNTQKIMEDISKLTGLVFCLFKEELMSRVYIMG